MTDQQNQQQPDDAAQHAADGEHVDVKAADTTAPDANQQPFDSSGAAAQPTVGRIVIYSEWGTDYAAIVTQSEPGIVGLHVFPKPGGNAQGQDVFASEGTESGTWHWPPRT